MTLLVSIVDLYIVTDALIEDIAITFEVIRIPCGFTRDLDRFRYIFHREIWPVKSVVFVEMTADRVTRITITFKHTSRSPVAFMAGQLGFGTAIRIINLKVKVAIIPIPLFQGITNIIYLEHFTYHDFRFKFFEWILCTRVDGLTFSRWFSQRELTVSRCYSCFLFTFSFFINKFLT